MTLPDPAIDPGYYTDLLPKRVLAWVVDLMITLIILLAVMVMTLFVAVLVFPFVWIAIAIAYRYVLLSRHGATWGMMLAALRLRRLDGTRPDPVICFWHAAIYSGSMASVIGQIASVALMLTTPYRQGLNDLILGTTMVHRDLRD